MSSIGSSPPVFYLSLPGNRGYSFLIAYLHFQSSYSRFVWEILANTISHVNKGLQQVSQFSVKKLKDDTS